MRHVVRQVHKERFVFVCGDEANGLACVPLSELRLVRGNFDDDVIANQRACRRLSLEDVSSRV